MPYKRCGYLGFFLLLVLIFPGGSSASTDPLTAFIFKADSLTQAGGDELLSPYIKKRAILVGAAVGQLLDVAFLVGESGNKDGEKENVAFAGRIARLYQEESGSGIPLEQVRTYHSWTPQQRDIRKQAIALEEEAVAARNAHELERAVELFTRVRTLYGKIGDKRSQAVTWGSLGVVHWYRGDMDAVVENYEKALIARREIEDRILEGKTLNGLGSANFQKGNYGQAVIFYNQAIELRRNTGDVGGLITSLTYLGNTYTNLGRLVKAREAFESALPILKQTGNDQQRCDIYNSIANLYSNMGRVKGSNEAYKLAINIAEAAGDLSREASYRINLSDNYRKVGRFRESLEQLDAASAALDKQPDPTKGAELHRNRGLTYMLMGELDRARDDLLSFLEESKGLENPSYHVEALINLGYLYRELAAHDKGLACALKAKTRAEELGDMRMVREAVALAADLERHLGHYENSLENWENALERDRLDGFQEMIIDDLLGAANTYSAMGRWSDARKSFYSALPMIQPSGISDVEWVLHFGIGHTYEKENPDSAVFHYEKAFDAIEKTSSGVGGAGILTEFFSGEHRFFYEEAARFYAQQSRGSNRDEWSARAFSTIEKAKARGLLELLETNVLQESSPAEEALLDSLYMLKAESPDAKEEQLRLEKKFLDIRENRLQASVGKLASGSSPSPAPSIAELRMVQEALPRRTALLEFALGDTTSLLWVIDRKGHELFEIPKRSVLQLEVRRLRDALSRPGSGDVVLRASSRKLYKSLLEPAEKRLSKVRNLVIVPDGVLFEVPFEILLTEEIEENTGWKELPFLARSFSPVYVPSASVYLQIKRSKKSSKFSRDLIAVGNPDFSTLGRKPGMEGESIAELPFAKQEIIGISSFFKDGRKSVLIGKEASEARFKSELKQGSARIIHLATHGIADPAEPAASSIYLCRDPDSGEDGYLYTLEILSMQMQAGLVVLSACESARGRISRGEGIVGLSRAFIASGTSGVVASLWSVSDISTAELMKEFYKKMLGKKKSACKALNEARLTMLENPDYAHPFYWSPFIVIGTERSPWVK